MCKPTCPNFTVLYELPRSPAFRQKWTFTGHTQEPTFMNIFLFRILPSSFSETLSFPLPLLLPDLSYDVTSLIKDFLKSLGIPGVTFMTGWMVRGLSNVLSSLSIPAKQTLATVKRCFQARTIVAWFYKAFYIPMQLFTEYLAKLTKFKSKSPKPQQCFLSFRQPPTTTSLWGRWPPIDAVAGSGNSPKSKGICPEGTGILYLNL